MHLLLVDNVGFASSVPVTPDPNSSSKKSSKSNKSTTKSAEKERGCHVKLNKFVRRLHDMLLMERDSGIVEWRRGLLVLFSTDAFSKTILPKYFNTRNFKTFRRQVRTRLHPEDTIQYKLRLLGSEWIWTREPCLFSIL